MPFENRLVRWSWSLLLAGSVGCGSDEPAPAPGDEASPTPTPALGDPATPVTMSPTAAATMPPTTAPTGPTLPNDEPPTRLTTGPSYAATVEAFFTTQCTPACHEPGGLLGGPGGSDPVQMDLTQGMGYAALTTGKSVQLATMWIVGTTVEDSYLWHKLNETFDQVGGTGARMPLTGELPAGALDAVRAWIEGGATP